MGEATHRSMLIGQRDSMLDSSISNTKPSPISVQLSNPLGILDLMGGVKHMLPIKCPYYRDSESRLLSPFSSFSHEQSV